MSTLEEICYECHNYFEIGKNSGEFVIENGNLSVDFLLEGQYFRIIGSIFNDGIYQYPETTLTDETFKGEVWPMAVPKTVVELVMDIDAWKAQYDKVNQSPYTSESFGGYSYTKGASTGGGNGNGLTWQSVFYDRMKRWYKLWA